MFGPSKKQLVKLHEREIEAFIDSQNTLIKALDDREQECLDAKKQLEKALYVSQKWTLEVFDFINSSKDKKEDSLFFSSTNFLRVGEGVNTFNFSADTPARLVSLIWCGIYEEEVKLKDLYVANKQLQRLEGEGLTLKQVKEMSAYNEVIHPGTLLHGKLTSKHKLATVAVYAAFRPLAKGELST